MGTPRVQLAVRIPGALVEGVKGLADNSKDKCQFDCRVLRGDDTQQELGFDPLTGSAIVWVALRFAGEAAWQMAMHIFSAAIYERLKAGCQAGQGYEILVRFPTGESLTVRTNEPLDLEALEERIKQVLEP